MSQSFLKPITFHLSRNTIFAGLSILGLGLFTYLTKRYFKTENETTNQYYTKPQENVLGIPNLTLTKNPIQIIYIFWNGDLSSTYLLIDLLLQDKIIQPLYIERYTILKQLEYDTLENMTKLYTEKTLKYKDGGNIQKDRKLLNEDKQYLKIKNYLEDVARIKKKQITEITQLEFMRKIIIKQYPEFQSNFLPTQYITTINKDLPHTTKFFEILKKIAPPEYSGIEFYEQITRFIKHYKPLINFTKDKIKDNDNDKDKINIKPRIILGYTRDTYNINLIQKISTLLDIDIDIDIDIEIPLREIDNSSVKFLATNTFNSDILRYLIQ